MFRTFACLTEQHALSIVAIAPLVCWISNVIAFRLLRHAGAAREVRRTGWLLAASFAIGAGIWSTHFIAMLGYDPGVVVGYETVTTLLSLVIAIVSALIGLLLFDRKSTLTGTLCGGGIIGLGVAAMHYVGMAGVQIPGRFVWDAGLVAASVIAACVFAPLALFAFVRIAAKASTPIAASILTVGIGMMHFIGMGAAEAIPDPSAVSEQSLPRAVLALGIAAAMLATVAFAGLALLAERLRLSNKALRAKSAQLGAALGNLPHGLCMFDRDKRLVLCNARYAALYGLPERLTRPGTSLQDIFAFRKAVGNAPLEMNDILAGRIALPSDGGTATFERGLQDGRTIRIRHNPMPDGGYVASHEDITDKVHAEARIAYMAHHDALTGLPNRVLFRLEMDRGLARVRRGEKLAVLCLDLDHFKAVNDTLGHPVGDALLKAVTNRLSGCVRETDTIARLGGDEFAIIQAAVEQPSQVTAFAERVIERLSAPFDLDGHHVVVGTSVGIAMAPTDGEEPDHLLKAADMALYRAKTDGRGTFRFFEAEMDARMQARRVLEIDLRQALPNGEFEIYYQPLVNLQAGQVSGFEALVRWNHPTRGRVSPADFIPLAEEIGLIVPIGAWVLRQACAEAMTWPKDVKIAVNLSPAQFKSRALVLDVVSALAASGLPAERLELEITETVMLQDTESTLATLHQLRALGVGIAMDDFGTGYSSLNYLHKFPFDKIKIDRCFVRDLDGKSESLAIVRAITGLSASLEMSTTAEGVETETQLEKLRSEGCTEAQGYLFSPPRPASEVAALLSTVSEQGRAAA